MTQNNSNKKPNKEREQGLEHVISIEDFNLEKFKRRKHRARKRKPV